MPSYLITGASRGLGLGFTTELLKDKNSRVIATARDPTSSMGLQALEAKHSNGRLHLLQMDVSNQDSIEKAARAANKLLPGGLDYLISNAGKESDHFVSWETIDVKKLMSEVEFSVVPQIMLLREFHPLVRKSQAKKVLVITSDVGSIETGQAWPFSLSYGIAKAALNMTIRKLSVYLKKDDGITTALIHPGLVGETAIGMGVRDWALDNTGKSSLSVETSAANCMKVLKELTPKDNGVFFNYDGSRLPW